LPASSSGGSRARTSVSFVASSLAESISGRASRCARRDVARRESGRLSASTACSGDHGTLRIGDAVCEVAELAHRAAASATGARRRHAQAIPANFAASPKREWCRSRSDSSSGPADPLELLEKRSELGVFGLTIPEQFGGRASAKSRYAWSPKSSAAAIGVRLARYPREIAAELILGGGSAEQRQSGYQIATGEYCRRSSPSPTSAPTSRTSDAGRKAGRWIVAAVRRPDLDHTRHARRR
jgi:alkylation response protein AidB-like acyl-CoA dehydrogenase